MREGRLLLSAAVRGWLVVCAVALAGLWWVQPAAAGAGRQDGAVQGQAVQGQQGGAVAAQSGAAQASGSESSRPSWLRVALLIGLPGIFGGLLFGMKGTSLSLPHLGPGHRWSPGVVADCLYGLAGGIVIFLVMPGQFQFSLSAGPLEVLKIIGLAIVGGYGGRSLVEKVLAEKIDNLQDQVDRQEGQAAADADATDLVNKHLDDNVESSPVSDEEVKKSVAGASVTVRQAVFEKVRRFRQEAFQEGRRDLLPRAIPVLEGLIQADSEKQYHRNHGQLGYVLKDMEPPDWPRAEAEFSRAIEIRDRLKVEGYGIYEYSRAKCRIHRDAAVETIRDDLDRALGSQLTADRLRKRDQYEQDVDNWLKQHRDELADWLKKNKIPI